MDGTGADLRATRRGRKDPLWIEVKTSSGKLEPHQVRKRRAVGRANYVVEWRATRRQPGTRRPAKGERNRDARAVRRRGGRVVRRSRGSATWQ